MNMDHFWEESVSKRHNTFNRILYALSWVVMITSALIAFMGLSSLTNSIMNGFNVLSLVPIVVCGGIAVYTWLMHDKLLTEYEYTFTNGSLDFAEVYNNKRRKDLGSLNVRTVDAFGKVASGSFQRYMNTPNIKRMNWFLNRDADLYYFYFSKDNVKKMIIFEPGKELTDMIMQYIPRGVFQQN